MHCCGYYVGDKEITYEELLKFLSKYFDENLPINYDWTDINFDWWCYGGRFGGFDTKDGRYVTEAWYKDIDNIDITNSYFIITPDKDYCRTRGEEDYIEQTKQLNLDDKYIIKLDFHS